MYTVDEKVIDEQYCICRFCFSDDERQELVNNKNYLDIIDNKLNEDLYDKGIYPVGKKDITFLTDIKSNGKLLGIAKTPILSEVRSLPLPTEVSLGHASDDITKEVERAFRSYLVKKDLYDKVDTDIVSELSAVNLDLSFESEGKVVNTIDDVDIGLDNPDKSSLIGHKLGEKVLFFKMDNNTICYGIIKKIEDLIPFSEEKCDLKLLKEKTKYSSFNELKNDYYKYYGIHAYLYLFTTIIIGEIVRNLDFKLSPKVYDFYRKKKHFFYKEDFECAKTKEKKEKAIKCNYFLDVFDKMLLLNSDESITSLNHSSIKEHLKQFENFDIYQKNEIDDFYSEIHLVSFCIKKGIIKDFDLNL